MDSLPVGARLLAELGVPRAARQLDSSPRSRVWRAELAGQPVVIKQLIEGPQADERFRREAAALTLAGTADPPVAPQVLGTDQDQRVLVLEYLEHRPPGDDWVIGYASALARLHATGATAAVDALPAWSGPDQADIGAFLGFARALGVTVPAAAEDELDGLLAGLARAPRTALLHGDPCPGNDLHTSTGVRFVDFEQATLGDGTIELAYLRIGFPTCWCVTAPSAGLLAAAEAAYRATAGPAAAGGDLTAACVSWLLRGDALVERALRGTGDHLVAVTHRDWQWGTATARQRLLHRLGVVSRLTSDRDDLSAFGQLTAAMRDRMLEVWPALTPLPAERPRG